MHIVGMNLSEVEPKPRPANPESYSTEEGLQCFIDGGVAVWCGCGAIYDRLAWSDCPRCCANQDVFAVPVVASFRARAV